jgi:hypothetical protein
MRTPGFSAVAALTLAIGIGASTAIFGVIDTALLAPLPFRERGSVGDPAWIVPLTTDGQHQTGGLRRFPHQNAIV